MKEGLSYEELLSENEKLKKSLTQKKGIEKSLIESNKKFKNFFDDDLSGKFLLNPDGNILDCNPSLLEIFGYSTKEELVGKNIEVLFKDSSEFIQNKAKLKQQKKIRNYETLGINKNGEEISIIENLTATLNKNNEIIGIIGSLNDVTEKIIIKKQLTDAIKIAEKNENNFKLIFESTGTANAIFDIQCVLKLQNKLSSDILDKGLYHCIGQNVFEIYGEENGQNIYKRIKRVIKSGVTETFETLFNLPIGKKWYRSTYHPIFNNDQKVVAVQVISQDITQLKNYEIDLVRAKERAEKSEKDLYKKNEKYLALNEELKQTNEQIFYANQIAEENEKKFRNLVWEMPVGVLQQGPQAEILLSNPAALELLGLTEEQLLGKSSFDPYWNVIHEDGSPFPGDTHPVPVAIATRKPVREVVMGVYRPATHDRVWLLVDAIPHLNDDGTVEQVICTFINISDRKAAEEALKQSEEQLKELNAAKDKFFSIIAHDLKNPFTVLLGFTNLLIENIDNYSDEKIEKFIKIINKTTSDTYNLLIDLLLWSKSQSGKLPYKPVKNQIKEISYEVVDTVKANAEVKNISVTLNIPDDVYVNADQNMLKTVLRNLLSNAIKFTHRNGKITVHAESDKANSLATIIVSDNGIGIEKQYIDKIFNLSEQFTTPGTANEKGSGLGLVLCKEFVEKQGGKIWVESQPDKGSKFIFTLTLSD